MPSGWTPSRDCRRGKSACVVSCMCIVDEPLAERIDLVAVARANTSDGCASDSVWSVRYCFDYMQFTVSFAHPCSAKERATIVKEAATQRA